MTTSIISAINDFRRARRRASIEQVLARFTGKSADLLSYEDVRRRLKAQRLVDRGLQDIPVKAIIGSVGRYNDFTRTFLPKHSNSERRWANLLVFNSEGQGLPPIEVYKVGEAYFVQDGNHRVSIAHELELPTIQAYVTEVITKVPLTPDTSLDDLIIKEEYVNFLESTKLDELRPEADFTLTAPGKYALLQEHIQVHQYFMGIDFDREIEWAEAVAHWYDAVYLPTIHKIRQRGILRDFPDRTEADLYVWLADHRAELQDELGWEVGTDEAVEDFALQHGSGQNNLSDEEWEKAAGLESVPPPGQWRDAQRVVRGTSSLFTNILVSVGEDDTSWHALDQAVMIAKRESAQIRGLHVVMPSTNQVELLERFESHVQAQGAAGQLAFDTGDLYQRICDRSRWTDLAVIGLNNPPGEQLLGRLWSGWRTILLRTPRPVLAVPGRPAALERALLAYDGSPKADEALFMATYLVKSWGISLVVLHVSKKEPSADILARARQYLEEHEVVTAKYVSAGGDPAVTILVQAEKYRCDFIVMGSYGASPMMELLFGSTLDQLLRNSLRPILVCR